MCTLRPAGQDGRAAVPAMTCNRRPYLHCLDLREVPRGNLVFSLQLNVDLWQPVDKLSFLVFLPKNTRHLLFQVADDVGVYLKGYMSVSVCHSEVQQDKQDGILHAPQHTAGTHAETGSSGPEEGKTGPYSLVPHV